MKKWKDKSLPFKERAHLAEEKLAEEKIKQIIYEAFLMPKLSIEKNNWWENRLYESKTDLSRIFPEAIGIAATFNAKLINAASNEMSYNETDEENELNEQIASESIVLLKNNKLLPMSREDVKKIAFIPLNADNKFAYMDNVNTSSVYTIVLGGLKKAHEKAEIMCPHEDMILDDLKDKEDLIREATAAAREADVVILAAGLSNNHDGDGNMGYKIDTETDKTHSHLSKVQQKLMEAVCNENTPAVLLNFAASRMDLAKASELCEAILQCWNPGQIVGEVAVRMIFGDYQPSGKLPVTFYKNIDAAPLYPFGYGLAYSFVEYYRIYLSEPKINAGEDIAVTIFLKNKGKYETKDVVQVYLIDEEATEKVPDCKLAAFKKVNLPVNEEVRVSLTIKSKQMALVNKEGKSIVEQGRFSLYVGGGQPDDTTAKLYNRDCLHIGFLVE